MIFQPSVAGCACEERVCVIGVGSDGFVKVFDGASRVGSVTMREEPSPDQAQLGAPGTLPHGFVALLLRADIHRMAL